MVGELVWRQASKPCPLRQKHCFPSHPPCSTVSSPCKHLGTEKWALKGRLHSHNSNQQHRRTEYMQVSARALHSQNEIGAPPPAAGWRRKLPDGMKAKVEPKPRGERGGWTGGVERAEGSGSVPIADRGW